ncbi:perlucin-like protein [Patiria miniata]|uniref:C-type lectin domain-containing protein n=1 Tax=Patiria miniata TaxID=46514 RepID=A0A914A101_PATMI|nr:perlucin-like protein [Patiria miniata]
MLVCILTLIIGYVWADGVSFQRPLSVCPPGWLAWQDACYILLPDRVNWWQAKTVCDRPGSSLVVPDSQEEQDFIWREMRSRMEMIVGSSTNKLELWIGCKDVDNTGQLTCLGVQDRPQFTNWNGGNPHHHQDQDCIRMAEKYGGNWGDSGCQSKKFASCEMRVSHRSYCLQADADGRFTPQCLLNHEIKNLTAAGVIGCGQACWAEPRCHSFNLWQKGDDKKVCQLNNASSIEADPAFLKKVESCNVFDL